MFSKIMTCLFITYFYTSSCLFFNIALLICLVTAPFDPLRKSLHGFACWWGHHYVRWNPFWRFRIEGLENLPRNQPCVLAANHQSYFDIMVLYGLFKPYKWVSKSSIFKMPFIGWNMTINQYVRIERDDMKSIKQMMKDCKTWLEKGTSIMIFPEGTRSPNGELGEFRVGPFKLATDCRVPVVPIVVNGTQKIMPKGTIWLNFKSDIVVRILPPIDPQEFNSTPRLLKDHVEAMVKENLDDIRGIKALPKAPVTAG